MRNTLGNAFESTIQTYGTIQMRLILFYFLIHRERERERAPQQRRRTEGDGERLRENFKQGPHSVQSLIRGSIPLTLG